MPSADKVDEGWVSLTDIAISENSMLAGYPLAVNHILKMPCHTLQVCKCGRKQWTTTCVPPTWSQLHWCPCQLLFSCCTLCNSYSCPTTCCNNILDLYCDTLESLQPHTLALVVQGQRDHLGPSTCKLQSRTQLHMMIRRAKHHQHKLFTCICQNLAGHHHVIFVFDVAFSAAD